MIKLRVLGCLLVVIMAIVALPVQAADETSSLPPLSAYGRLPGVEDMALSPSGDLLATVTTLGEQRRLVIVSIHSGVLRNYGLDDMKVRGLHWAGEDHLIVRASSTQNLGFFFGGKHELSNLMIVNVKTGEAEWPLQNSRKVFNASFHIHPPLKADGRWYQCVDTLASVSADAFDLSCIELERGRRRIIARGRRDGQGWAVGAGLNVLAYETYNDISAKWELRAYKSKDVLVSAKDNFGTNSLAGPGRSPGTVAYYQHDARGAGHLFEIAVDGKSAPVELFADINIVSLYYDAEGLLTGVVKEADVPELEMLDAHQQAIVVGTRKAFPDSNVHFISMSADWQKLIVYTDGAGDSGTWWYVNIPTGDAKPIGYNRPEIRSRHVATPSMWQYKASDGLTIPAIVTTPVLANKKNLPLIVLPHGGPQSRDYLGFDWLAQAFASRGYVVLQPNFRGSGNYSVAFRDAGFGEWGRKMQTDLSDGVAALADTGLIDSKRVCIVGASYGGYAALAGVTLQQGLYRCAVSIAGLSDLPIWLRSIVHTRQRDDERYVEQYLGVDSPRADELKDISPAHHAARADAPILLIHGEDDTRVPIVHSEKMYSRLKKKKKPVTFVKLKGEDHFLSKSDTRQKTIEAAVGFVMEHNPPQAK